MFSLSFGTPNTAISSQQVKPSKTEWQNWEAALLVDTALSSQVIDAFLPDLGSRQQTMIHAFDLQHSEILLDGLWGEGQGGAPCDNSTLGREVWLQIATGDLYYFLQAECTHSCGRFTTLRILHSGITRNRRWEDRIYFPRLSAPRVSLQLAAQVLPDAQLSNLSAGGAQIFVFGPQVKEVLRQENAVHCSIKFSPELEVTLRAHILQRQFSNTPCLHSVLRVRFSHAARRQRTQLQSLILAYQSANFQRVA